MKKPQVGLIVEGNSTRSAILSCSRISEEIGPIKSASVRLARRASNQLRAGYAVKTYEELQAAKLILIRVPDTSVARIANELCHAELPFPTLSFVLCESWMPKQSLDTLLKRGASTATLVGIPGCQKNWFAVEGERTAVRRTKAVFKEAEANIMELATGTKDLLFTAGLMTTVLPVRYFMAAQQALRLSGISGNLLDRVLAGLATQMLKETMGGGRTAATGVLAECPPETATAYLEAVQREYPEFADVFQSRTDAVLAEKIASAMPPEKTLANIGPFFVNGEANLPHSF
jgi:hypothetical protein